MRNKKYLFTGNSLLLLFFLIITASGCKNKKQKEAPLPDVKVIEVIQRNTPLYEEFVGQIYGLKDIPIRARVEGFLEGIFFAEGMPVKKGQLLYSIDPEPFLAEVAARKSELAEAKTILVNAENELKRYKPLAEINAVSESDLDAAQATRDAAEAGVEAAKANLDLANIRLSYTKIKSPIRGLIGKTEAKEGEFVGKEPNVVILNTVSRIDTVRVQFFLTERDYLLLIKEVRERMRSGEKLAGKIKNRYTLELILSDGSVYDHKGAVDFINRNVDPTTGSMLVEAHFPNPDGILRPGLYAKVKVNVATIHDALLVPQRCVIELQGKYSVFVVNKDGTTLAKQVTVGERVKDLWLIKEGLSPGDKVVIDGIQKIASGTKVDAELIEFESNDNPE